MRDVFVTPPYVILPLVVILSEAKDDKPDGSLHTKWHLKRYLYRRLVRPLNIQCDIP